MMVAVVQSGTANESLGSAAYPVAAKTGTANSTEDKAPFAWMVAFAPADNPQVAVAVIVESADISREAVSGNALAGPIAKAVMDAVINP
jgi:peptidoglycan glycosyltransferase